MFSKTDEEVIAKISEMKEKLSKYEAALKASLELFEDRQFISCDGDDLNDGAVMEMIDKIKEVLK